MMSALISYELVRCATATCEAVAAIRTDNIVKLQDTQAEFFCSRGHSMSYGGPSRAQLQLQAESAGRIALQLQQEARMRVEAEQRLARSEEEKLAVSRQLREARRTARKAVTIGAHAVRSTKSAHAKPRESKP